MRQHPHEYTIKTFLAQVAACVFVFAYFDIRMAYQNLAAWLYLGG